MRLARISGGFVVALVVGLFAVLPTPVGAAADLLTDGDALNLKAALKALDAGDRQRARSRAAKIADPVAAKVVTWARLVDPHPTVSFAEIDAFMTANPAWPSPQTLQRRAEAAMEGEVTDAEALAWFAGREPISGEGKARFGLALLAVGREEEGIRMVRDAWINGNFTKRREQVFYNRIRKYLTPRDHERRLDRLLWDGRYWPVRRMLWKVGPDYRLLATARLWLRFERGNVDHAIAKVPRHMKDDPGLVYERLRWRRRKGKYDSAVDLLARPPDDLVRPERWWIERAYLARRALRDGRVTEAYRIAHENSLKENGFDEGAAYAEAEWLSGWIALRFLGEARRALRHFVKMYNAVNFPVSRARGAYWAGRALEIAGDTALAEWWFAQAIHHPETYYGQLALAHLRPGDTLALPAGPVPNETEAKAFAGHELVRAVRILDEVGDEDRINSFIRRLEEMRPTPGWRRLAAELAREIGRHDLTVLAAKRSGREGWSFPDLAYPTVVLPRISADVVESPIETALVLGVIRQESAFNMKAQSHANAQGLMQLLPRTAHRVAKRLNVPFERHRLTSDSAYNLLLGRAYLSGLLAEMEGSYVLALAAYNAGPSRVKRWIRDHGDPRDSEVDTIDWIEMIPFRETRNYLQRVLENVQVYRARIAPTEVALGLERDLHR